MQIKQQYYGQQYYESDTVFSVYHIGRYIMSLCLITSDVNHDHLVFPRFLIVKSLFFLW